MGESMSNNTQIARKNNGTSTLFGVPKKDITDISTQENLVTQFE